MSEVLSIQTLEDGLSPIVAFEYPNAADRIADTNRDPSDPLVQDKVARELDTGDIYIVQSLGPLVWRPLSPGPGMVNGYIEVTNQSTTSATLEDIPGLTFSLTLKVNARIKANLTLQTATIGGSPATGSWAISIGGVDGSELARFLSGSNDDGIVCVQERSDELSPGAYTVTGRCRRVSGASSVNAVLAQLSAMVVGV